MFDFKKKFSLLLLVSALAASPVMVAMQGDQEAPKEEALVAEGDSGEDNKNQAPESTEEQKKEAPEAESGKEEEEATDLVEDVFLKYTDYLNPWGCSWLSKRPGLQRAFWIATIGTLLATNDYVKSLLSSVKDKILGADEDDDFEDEDPGVRTISMG